MNILYIGKPGVLSSQFIERLSQEGEELFFLSENNFIKKITSSKNYRYFKLSDKPITYERAFISAKPDVVVFSAIDYLMNTELIDKNSFLTLINHTLDNCVKYQVKQFVYLSSLDVYGNEASAFDEEATIAPITEKGLVSAQGEYITSLYANRDKLLVTVFRAAEIYGNVCNSNQNDFLSEIFNSINESETINLESNNTLYPLHVSDYVEAIKRAIESKKSGVYNISSSFSIQEDEIYKMVANFLGKEVNITANTLVEKPNCNIEKIKKVMGWIDFRNIQALFKENKISYIQSDATKEKKEKHKVNETIRKTLENLILFGVFCFIHFLCLEHNLFSQIDWLLIYVAIASLLFGIKQSAFAIVLGSIGYLLSRDISIFEMNNFYSYSEVILVIVQFVFFGIIISYSIDMLREKVEQIKRTSETIEEELEDLKQINKENVLIKNEYKNRLLDSKMSTTQLYEILKRIMVLNPNRVFMEIIYVISEIMETNTVAIYMRNKDNPHLRLVNSLNKESIVGGKSWNISSNPDLLNALDEGELYRGNTFENEPAVVVPISNYESNIVILVIKELSFAQQTLYHTNLLKTLIVLIKDATNKATEYESNTKSLRYIENTPVLTSVEFKNTIALAKEKYEKNLSDFCVIELVTPNVDTADIVGLFRNTDYFGTDDSGKLYVLLNNTNLDETTNVISRLKEKEVIAKVSHHFD